MATSFSITFRTGTQAYRLNFSGADSYTIADLVSQVNRGLDLAVDASTLVTNGQNVTADTLLTAGATYEQVKNQGKGGQA